MLDSIARYYRRAVTESRPMSHLIAGVMVTLLGALAFRVVRGHDPAWLMAASIVVGGRSDPLDRDAYVAQCRPTRRSC